MNKSSKNLWILTEEYPKEQVLQTIFSYFCKDMGCGFFADSLRIIPILDKNKNFTFTYKVIGFTCSRINNIYIKIVSGYSSFIDYLIYYQNNLPSCTDIPEYVIEETKTDDSESRNTGVYQRASKFIYIDQYYPTSKKIMLYNIQIQQKVNPTETNIFGTRLLRTLGIDILGKKLQNVMMPFETIDELINYKNNMRRPPSTNVPILIKKSKNKIQISGRLFKSKRLSHDPNIGALSLIAAVLRKLGWKKCIEITQHGLEQIHIEKTNKFLLIAEILNISLENLTLRRYSFPSAYWKYEQHGEKLVTIFLQIIVENFTHGYSIFENHAGCEKGYFKTSHGKCIALSKYSNRDDYKAGDKSKIIYIPDLVLLDIEEQEIIIIEGKKFENITQGIKELDNYDSFDDNYIKNFYSNFRMIKTVVLYGSDNTVIYEVEVGLLLNSKGGLVLGINAPKLFRQAIYNLLDFWQ